jgi:hypothetical protein
MTRKIDAPKHTILRGEPNQAASDTPDEEVESLVNDPDLLEHIKKPGVAKQLNEDVGLLSGLKRRGKSKRR